MKYVILVSHGTLAYGMKSVLEMFAGKRDDVLAMCLENGMAMEEYRNGFIRIIEKLHQDDEIILIGDILGGSPLSQAIELLENHGLFNQTTVLCGMNVPVCLTAVLNKDVLDKEQLISTVLEEGKTGIKHCVFEDVEEDEEL